MVLVFVFVLLTTNYSPHTTLAFVGPSSGQTPGQGSGYLSIDANGNLGFGTNLSGLGTTPNTPPGGTFSKIFTIAASSTPPGINLRNLGSGCGSAGCLTGYTQVPASYVIDIVPWGWLEFYDALAGARRAFVMSSGFFGVGQTPTTPSALFMVNGGDARFSNSVYASGSFVGNLSGSLSAGNVSSGLFGSLSSTGNYAFPSGFSVAINTSTVSGIPQTLSVYGGGYFSGNVGIGTTAPAFPLDIVRAVGSSGNLLIEGNGAVTGDPKMLFRDLNGGSTDFTLAFDKTNGFSMIGGNVGIGTTGPGSKLEVSGATSNTPVTNGIIKIDTTGTVSTGYGGGLLFAQNNDASTLTNYASITGSRVNSSVNNAVDLVFSTGNPTDLTPVAERMRITSLGNVGIGTTSPGRKLTVNDTTDTYIGFQNGGVEKTVIGAETTGDRRFIVYDSASSTYRIVINGMGNVGIGSTSPAGRLDVANGSIVNVGAPINPNDAATKSYVDSAALPPSGTSTAPTQSGYWTLNNTSLYPINTSYNVGIGTTNPGAKLDVAGDVAVGNPTYNNGNIRLRADTYTQLFLFGSATNYHGAYLILNSGGASDGAMYLTYGDYTAPATSTTKMYFRYANNGAITNQMVLTPSGYVGINTTSPGTNLDVNGNAESSIYYDRDNTNYYMDLAANVMPYSLVTAGSVGIGTTSPGAKLDVYGYLRAGNFGTNLNYISVDAATGVFPFTTTAQWAEPMIYRSQRNPDVGGGSFPWNNYGELILQGTSYGNGYNRGISFVTTPDDSTSPTIKMRIDSSGNVGIGTTNPGTYNLNVAGTSYFGNQMTVNGTLNMGSNGITMNQASTAATINGVYKLTVTTIDPLYKIGGTNYATYASAIAGGVKEEYVGKGKLEINSNSSKLSGNSLYSYTIDFNKVGDGSDLWVWRSVVDFSNDNVEVLATPIGVPAPIAYTIEGNTITFTTELPSITTRYNKLPPSIQFSYRLIGKRYDWKNWPTLSEDQKAGSGVVVPVTNGN